MRRHVRESQDLPLLDQAAAQVEEHTEDFVTSLTQQAQLVAQKERVNAVSDVHVEEARRLMMQPRLRPTVWKELAKIVGATFVGVFIREAVATGLQIHVGIAVLGMLGVLLVVVPFLQLR
jgi:hypothetical protein